MATAALIAVGLCCSLLSAVTVKGASSNPEITGRLKKILPEGAADFIMDAKKDEYDPLQDGEDELQAYRNELSALYKEEESRQDIYDTQNENKAEDMAALIQQRRGRKFRYFTKNTQCAANIYKFPDPVDCGKGGAITGFKLLPCGSDLYKYEYTCLGGISTNTDGEVTETPAVTLADMGDGVNQRMDVNIDLRTLYRHNVRCDVGGTNRFDNTGVDGDSEEDVTRKQERANYTSKGDTPLNSFRYEYKEVPGNKYKNSTKYTYKCLDEYTSGKCLPPRTSVNIAALKPENLVSASDGLQSLEVKCPTNHVITRFQLKSGGKTRKYKETKEQRERINAEINKETAQLKRDIKALEDRLAMLSDKPEVEQMVVYNELNLAKRNLAAAEQRVRQKQNDGKKTGEEIEIPPFPLPGEEGVYKYEYTCCEMKP
tara:strand:- start:5330 stop:6616 length:1287 start_codon:yes stop_codon:yes gene_type:complete